MPFLDLVTPHLELMRKSFGRLPGGPENGKVHRRTDGGGVRAEFATFCDAKYCVGVGSGTDALRFGLIAAGIRPDDVVITVPNTFIATTRGDFAGRRQSGVRRRRSANL